MICVSKVLNWPCNFSFYVHKLCHLFVPEITGKDQIILVLINKILQQKERPSTRSIYNPTSKCLLLGKRPETLLANFGADYPEEKKKETDGCEIGVCTK